MVNMNKVISFLALLKCASAAFDFFARNDVQAMPNLQHLQHDIIMAEGGAVSMTENHRKERKAAIIGETAQHQGARSRSPSDDETEFIDSLARDTSSLRVTMLKALQRKMKPLGKEVDALERQAEVLTATDVFSENSVRDCYGARKSRRNSPKVDIEPDCASCGLFSRLSKKLSKNKLFSIFGTRDEQ